MATLFGAPVEFFIFAAVLIAVAVAHKRAMTAALVGLAALLIFKLTLGGFTEGSGFAGLVSHFVHEWVILADILLLLLGFSILSNQFEKSGAPDAMPRLLPDNWTGGVVLLAMVFVMSAFLDNIAAAVIGGVLARHVYRGEVSVGYVAAIVAASNAGGAGSVIGDTTTTLMWIGGVSPLAVLPAFIGSFAAFAILAIPAALQQRRRALIIKHAREDLRIDWLRASVVFMIIAAIVTANATSSALTPELHHNVPVLGIAIWVTIAATALIRKPDWSVLGPASKGAIFLSALVACASLIPIDNLPEPSVISAFSLGVLSAVFDNIPLTALALRQQGYDWAVLAYAVGFGGSMMWFGSSAGVAISNLYPQARSTAAWVKEGWYIPIAYIVGFAVLFAVHGWTPTAVAGR